MLGTWEHANVSQWSCQTYPRLFLWVKDDEQLFAGDLNSAFPHPADRDRLAHGTPYGRWKEMLIEFLASVCGAYSWMHEA